MPAIQYPICVRKSTWMWVVSVFSLLLLYLPHCEAQTVWKRSMLEYYSPTRSSEAWKHHLMRVDANGGYTRQWLFDAG